MQCNKRGEFMGDQIQAAALPVTREQEHPPLSKVDLSKRPHISEKIIQGFLFVCGAFSILTTLGIVYELSKEALLFFTDERVSLLEFFSGLKWQPQVGEFGILPLLNATLMTTAFAMLIALPLGLGVAIYLSEYASPRMRNTLKPILEILAGIPTVVYGYFALTFMTPILRSIFGINVVSIYNTASAGIVMGILILPLVSSMSEDALSAVPRSLREAAYSLGATKLETAIKIVVPAAISGIAAAFIISISRAIGETMIVAIAAGAGPNFTFNPFQSAETMTGHIVRISGGDLSYDSIDYNSIFAIGLMLFFMTLTLNIISQRIVRRFQEVYE
jgi:phosphate transport system permease protein